MVVYVLFYGKIIEVLLCLSRFVGHTRSF